MRLFITSLLLSLAAASLADEGRKVLAITAGEQAASQPWMAGLLRSRYADPYVAQFCGATLIAPDWVLTAAHCVAGMKPAEVDVLTGTPVLRVGEGNRHAVDTIVVHPGFVAPGSGAGVDFDNDIALLRLQAPVEDAEPVGLAGAEFDIMQAKPGTSSLLLGWGATAYDNDAGRASNYPRDLRQALLPIAAGPDCVAVMGSGDVTRNMLCAGDTAGGADSCVRDSGGPLLVADSAGWRQLGIVSWGFGCARPGSYGVYTRVARYAQWISDQVCAPGDLPPRPRVTALRKGLGTVTLEWSDGGEDLRYRVYYRPALTRSPIRHIEAGAAPRLTSAAPWGVPFDVAVQAYRGPCLSAFSDIHGFTL